MPNGQSVIGTAKTMTLSVGKALDETHTSMLEYEKHLESRRNHLEVVLRDSGQDDVKQMLAEVNSSIEEGKKAISLVQDAAERAPKIEARL